MKYLGILCGMVLGILIINYFDHNSDNINRLKEKNQILTDQIVNNVDALQKQIIIINDQLTKIDRIDKDLQTEYKSAISLLSTMTTINQAPTVYQYNLDTGFLEEITPKKE